MARRRIFIAGLLLTMTGMAVTYVHGFSASNMVYLGPDTDNCSPHTGHSGNSEVDTITYSLLPLRHTCHWPDGSIKELVPWYVNPLLLVSLIACVACIGLTIRAQAQRKRAKVFDEENTDDKGDPFNA